MNDAKDWYEISKWIVWVVSCLHWLFFRSWCHSPYECAVDAKIVDVCVAFERRQLRLMEVRREGMRIFYRSGAAHGSRRSRSAIARRRSELDVLYERHLAELEVWRSTRIKELLLERSKLGYSAVWQDFLWQYGEGRPYLFEVKIS